MNHFYASLRCCLVFLCISSFCKAQNLVPNHSFENVNCPVNYTVTVQPGKLSTAISDWYNTNAASPDLFTDCGNTNPPNSTMVPNIIFGYQYAQDGNNFMGFGFYSGWYEYIGVKLTAPLEAGETYQVSFWVSCADAMLWATNKLGAYFSTDQIIYNTTTRLPASGVPHAFTPQVVSDRFLTDTNWVKVSGEFVAAGGEQYLTIGYFSTVTLASGDFQKFDIRANPNYPTTTGTATNPRCYYYIDNVSVQKSASLPIQLTGFTAKITDGKVKLDWKTASESNNCRFEIERSEDGVQFHTLGTRAGAVNSSIMRNYDFTDPSPVAGRNYYRIKQVDCDGKNSYSKTLTVNFAASGFSVYPNPVLNQLTIDRNTAAPAQAIVYDLTGKELKSYPVKNARETLHVNNLLPGTYIIKIVTAQESVSQKFIKQ